MSGIRTKVFKDDPIEKTLAALEESLPVMFELSKGRPIWINYEIEDTRQARSGAQNRMFWAMFTDIAEGMSALVKDQRYTKEDAHDYLIQVRYGVDKVTVGKEVIHRLKQTSKMDSAEAADFITWCLAWAADKNISVCMPAEYSEWAREAGQ